MAAPIGTLDVRLTPVAGAGPDDAAAAGSNEAALIDSVDAARRAKTLTPHDAAAVCAAVALARALDQSIAYGAGLDAIVKGTTALRHWYTVLNLTPAARERDNSWRDVPTEPDEESTDWSGRFGAATLGDPA